MIEFLMVYGVYILEAISLIIAVLLLVLKKRPKTLDDFFYILYECSSSVLPRLVVSAESPGNGQEKKSFVMSEFLRIISNRLGRSLSSKERKVFEEFTSQEIELILTTPQKKGA